MNDKPGITKLKLAAMLAAVGMSLSAAKGPQELAYVFAAVLWACLYLA